VIGDTVNVAQRVEGLTKEFGVPILIAQGTYDCVKDAIPAKRLGPVEVKGKEEPISVYAVG